jgi:putative hydroxymethylpyrimidine transport system permease protein
MHSAKTLPPFPSPDMRGKGTAEQVRRWLLPSLLLAASIGIWQLGASTGVLADVLGLESFLVPSPAEIGESLWENRSLLAENAWVTLREILLGFAIAVVAGIGFAVALHLWTTVRLAAYPLLITSQTIPILALAPIFVVWFGYGIGPKLAVVALVCFFPITVTTLDGLRSVDPEMTKFMRTLDASRWQIFRRVEAPTALPSAFSGARLAAVFTTIAALFGEWAGSNAGLGHLILQDNAQLETARMFAAFAILSAIALGLFGLLALAERRVVTWR